MKRWGTATSWVCHVINVWLLQGHRSPDPPAEACDIFAELKETSLEVPPDRWFLRNRGRSPTGPNLANSKNKTLLDQTMQSWMIFFCEKYWVCDGSGSKERLWYYKWKQFWNGPCSFVCRWGLISVGCKNRSTLRAQVKALEALTQICLRNSQESQWPVRRRCVTGLRIPVDRVIRCLITNWNYTSLKFSWWVLLKVG